MIFVHLPTASSYRPRLPSWLGLLGMGCLWCACAAVALGQERQRPARLPIPGEVVRSISIRVTAGQPRFVVAARVVEEADEVGLQKESAEVHSTSVPFESPPEIVDYFKRTAQQQIADIDRICELSEQQKAKLELAAMGDMSRLVRESREVREKYSGRPLHNQHHNMAVFEDVAVINRRLSEGVLRDGSMFLMVLKSLLAPTQVSQLAQAKFGELTIAWPMLLPDDQLHQLWQLVLRTHDGDSPPLLWAPKQCRTLVSKLPRQELVNLLGESKADTLLRWCER